MFAHWVREPFGGALDVLSYVERTPNLQVDFQRRVRYVCVVLEGTVFTRHVFIP